MADTLTWELWDGLPWLSVLTWLLLVLGLLTLVRPVVVTVSRQVFRVVRHALIRLASRAQKLAGRIQVRNSMLVMTLGRQFMERQINRQTLQLQEALTQDLAQVEPQGAQLSKLIERMEDDYAATREPVSEPPEWYRAAEGLLESKAAQAGNRTLEHLLQQLHGRVQSESRHARQDYRRAITERHQLLSQFLPYWRRLLRMQGDIGQGVRRIEHRAERLEQLLEHYAGLATDSPRSLHHAVGSVLVHFTVAVVVMVAVLVLAVGSFWSFSAGTQLILPQVSAGNVFMMSIALMSAQVLTGMVLLEAMQVTRLFRAFWTIDDRVTRWLRSGAFLAMILWSVLNVLLAYLATGAEQAIFGLASESANGVLVVRLLLAGLTPWVLMLVVIPLEPLLNGLRIISGQLLVWGVAVVGAALRLLSLLTWLFEQLWLGLYDLICAPVARVVQVTGQWYATWQVHQARKRKQKNPAL